MMEQLKNHDCDQYNSMEPGNKELEPTSQGFMLDHTSCINSNMRPPELNFSDAKPVLNYSIQTGEEFALEFMRDRVNTTKPSIPNTACDPNYTTGYLELKGILGISHAGSESGSDISMLSAVEKGPKEFEWKNSSLCEDKSNYGSVQSVPQTSWDNSNRGTVHEYASSGASESSSTKIKILCSFGGRMLPRPSDGKLRYVGGETRIIRMSKDVSWQELWQKTITIYDQTHTIRYQLPGEDLDALVSVSNDEDLQNMMEECHILQDGEGSKKLRMFLFSSNDLEDDYFGLGNSDGDSEIQYVVAVNGMDMGSRKNSTLHGLASSSGNNLDELDGQNVERDNSTAAIDFVEFSSYMASSSATQSCQPILPSFSNNYETHSHSYNGQMMHHEEAKQYPLHPSNYSPSGESSSLLPLHGLMTQQGGLTEGQPSTVLCIQDPKAQVKELRLKSDNLIQQEDGDENIQPSSKDCHVPSQPLDGNVEDYFPVEEASAVIPTLKGELPLKSDGRLQEPVQVSSPLGAVNPVTVPKVDDNVCHTSNSTFTPGYVNSESDPIDLSYLEASVPPQRVFYSERIPREQAELLNRFSKSDDSLGSQFLLNQSRSDAAQQDFITESVSLQTEQPISIAKPLYKDPQTIADGVTQFQNLNQAVSNPVHYNYAVNEDGTLKAENEANCANNKDKNVLVGETSEAGLEFPAASQVASVKHHGNPAYGLPELQWSDRDDSNFTTDNTQGHDQPSAWIGSSAEPSVGLSRSETGDILIDINDRFPRDFLSDIFSKVILSEGSSGISPLQKDGAGLSLNIENRDPKHWSFFQKLAGDNFARRDVSLIDQDHFVFSSALPKVEEEAPISYKFTPLMTDEIPLSQVDSEMNYGGDDQKELPGTIGADIAALHADHNPSQVKGSECMQFDNFVVNPRAADSEYEDGTRNIVLPPLDPSLVDFDISSLQIIENEDLEELRELGSGTFGTVYHGKWRGTDVAINGIVDFDSASPGIVERKPSKFEVEASSRVLLNEEDDDCENRTALHEAESEPDFSGITDFDFPPPVEEKPSRVKIEGQVSSRDHLDGEEYTGRLDVPVIPGTTNLNSHLEEKKPLKVKMEGRRRLCKVSSKEDNDDDDNNGKNRAANHDLEFSALADLDTPPPLRNAVEKDTGSENEIRDILNDLSSRLEFLSIKKNRAPKIVDLRGESLSLVKDEVNYQTKKEDLPEYTSAASSFSLTSDPSDSSSDATNNSRVGGGTETWVDKCQEEIDQENEYEVDNLVGRVSRPKNTGKGQKKNETKRVGRKSVPVGHSLAAKFELHNEDDDDCVILSDKKLVKKVDRRRGKFQEKVDDSDNVDLLDNYNDDSVSGDENSITLRGPKLTYVLPGKIVKMLYPHQREGLKWLWSLHYQGKGGILGDDMGLGKTMQICGFLAGLFHSCLIKRALVVAPKTLLSHWIKELSVVGLAEKTREYFGTCAKTRQYELQYILQDKGVLLTTYDIVRNNVKSLRGDYYFHDERSEDDVTWDYMILDEGHLIKNPGTQRAKSLLEIPSAHRIVISGTPIQNNLKELWALFNFCCPELLGDKKWFKEKYESAILRGNDKNASDREKRIGSTVAKELRERIQPCFLRRLKSEVFCEDDATEAAKLSKKNEIIVWLKLTSCQRQLYEAFLNSELVLSAFDGSPLAALTILKKICDHPLLLTKRAAEDLLEGMDSMLNQEDSVVAEKLAMHIADVTESSDFKEKHDNVSCKISFILSLLDHLLPEGHCVLIFSQTRKMLNLIQESLVAKCYEFVRIDGTTKASDRVKIVDDFQEGIGAPIFLLTSQVGGLGLTLTKADRVIVVDPAWNPSTDNQSVDRAYRIGQKKDVLVYRLMTCGTIEEKIYRKQIFKGGLFKTATEHKEQTRYFSQQDLRELFSLPKQGFDVSLTQQQLHEEHDHQHTMNESLEAHVKFLETQGIAGVSHHSLLFSKTAPVPVVQEEEEIKRVKGATFMGNSSSTSRLERDVCGAKYAFNPKDVKLYRNSSSMGSVGKPTETEIKERINRLSQILTNKVIVSKLPDKGENIQKQIAELKLEFDMIHVAKRTEKEVIHLDDDIAGEFQRVLNV